MSNSIHPTTIFGDRVNLGSNNVIHPFTVILGPTDIGDDNIIGPHVVIGMPGKDTKNPRYNSSNCVIKIGNRNIIREFTSIQKPIYEETILDNDIHLMQSVNIPHDAHISNNVVITDMCSLAGHTHILEGANLGMGCMIHQFSVIGQYSIIAMGMAVLKNVKPFSKIIMGPISVNEYAVNKFGFQEYLDEIKNYVIRDIKPTSKIIVDLVDEFNEKHKKSKRLLY